MNTRATPNLRRMSGLQGLLTARAPWHGCTHGLLDELDRDGWWTENRNRFLEGTGGLEKPGPLFMFERAMSLPQIIREKLIRHFFPDEDQEGVLNSQVSKNCLIRAYLGCRVTELDEDHKKERLMTLRNSISTTSTTWT